MRLRRCILFLSLGIAVAGNTYAQNATLSLDMIEQYDRQCARSC